MSDTFAQIDQARQQRRLRFAGGAIIVLLTLLAYSNTPFFDFIWDDEQYVQNNRLLHDVNGVANTDGLVKIWKEPRSTPQYYPVVFTTFWLEYQLWDLNPAGYHVVNVLLQILNGLLLWAVCRAIGLPRAAAWLIAAIFAVHPVHVESVAWITERKNLLSGLFYLSAAWTYLRFSTIRDGELKKTKTHECWGWYGASLVLFAGALLSKSVTCSLPAALILVMLWRRKTLTPGRLLPLAPMFILGLLAAMHTASIEREHVGAEGADFAFSFIERCLIASKALLFYPMKVILPYPLIFNYERWTIDGGNLLSYWSIVVVLLVGAGLVWLYLKGVRGPFIALAFYAGTVLPALGFFNVYPHIFSFVADHFQYLASIGTIAMVVMLAARGLGSDRRLLIAGGVVLVLLTGLSWRQTEDYRDLGSLWTHTIAKNPDAWMPQGNLASLYLQGVDDALRAGDTEQVRRLALLARGHATLAVEIKPDHPNNRSRLSEALRLLGENEDALTTQQIAVDQIEARFEPGAPRPRILADEYFKLGRLHHLLNHLEAAIAAYERALEIRPNLPLAHAELGRILALRGDVEGADAHFTAVLQSQPNNFLALSTLAGIRAQQGRHVEAESLYDRAIPAATGPQEQIQIAMRQAIHLLQCPDDLVRNPNKAIFIAEQISTATNRSLPNTLDVLAMAYAAAGRFEDAIRVTEEAAQLARRVGIIDLATQIESRLDYYRSRSLPPEARRAAPSQTDD